MLKLSRVHLLLFVVAVAACEGRPAPVGVYVAPDGGEITTDGGGSADGGRLDGGTTDDGGRPADGGGTMDGGLSPDGGTPRDGGLPDAGTGTCHPACPSSSRCVGGQCVLIICPGDETNCDGTCINTNTDESNCGACGRVCLGSATGEAICSNSDCALHCVLDPEGVTCPAETPCVAGHCCPTGQTWCTDRCTDTRTDLANCGGCNVPCTAPSNGTASCSSSQCSVSCRDGRMLCGSACVDTLNDASNCGGCGHVCDTGVCSGGTCAVPSTTCTIDPSISWQTCGGFNATSGTGLVLYASGRWVWSPIWQSNGCEAPGTTASPVPGGFEYRQYTAYNHGALVWGISGGHVGGAFDNAVWDSSRSAYRLSVTPNESGLIMFRINDEDASISNNTGSMTVRIERAP